MVWVAWINGNAANAGLVCGGFGDSDSGEIFSGSGRRGMVLMVVMSFG